MVADWLADLLLESAAPPPNWLPNRASRLADARLTLRRRFGHGRATNRPGHHLRDLGSAYPLFSGSRVVSGSEIEADVEEDITSVNPPILQGWAAIGLVAAVAGEVSGFVAIADGELTRALARFIGSAVVWLAAVGIVGAYQREIALGSTGVVVRRWTDVWLGRPGERVGEPPAVRIGQVGRHRVDVVGDHTTMSFDIRLWPRSAREDLVEEPPIWGVRMDPAPGDRHRRRHPDIE
jgi:hypothetical protein